MKISWIRTCFMLLFIVLLGCIEKYNPDVNEYVNLIVINGSIIKGNSIQTVTVSRTAAYDEPYGKKRISGCVVDVIKENGSVFSFTEQASGTYTAAIPQEEMQFGDRFKVQIQVPYGNLYESDYDQVSESSPIESFYYEIESNHTSESNSERDTRNGYQFYADLKAPENATKNYMWQMEETWKFYAYYELYYRWYASTQEMVLVGPQDSLNHICWGTSYALGIYASSTENLSVNEKKKIPLNFLNEDDRKLWFGYSVLAKQYALSDAAYIYWYKNQVETQESGGLYQTQPSYPVTNIHCLTNPDEKVLGFFWVSSYSEKRLSFFDYTYADQGICGLSTFNILEDGYKDRWLDSEFLWADPICFDCTVRGATTVKPDFWP